MFEVCYVELSDYPQWFELLLQLVMSSDQLGSIQEPVVMVDFDISKDGQHTAESVELSKEELDGFVASLEAANKVCIKTTLQSCTV